MVPLEMRVLFPERQQPQVLHFAEPLIQRCVKKLTTAPCVLVIKPKWDL